MKIKELTLRPPVTIAADATLTDAALQMDAANVGALLVTDGDRLVGIVTDRDVVVRAVARRLDPDARIDGVMTTDIVTIDGDADVREAYKSFGKHGVRRLPVMGADGVAGMLTLDDLLIALAADLDNLVHPIVGEVLFGHHPVPVPAVP